jgi:hypothetical protein
MDDLYKHGWPQRTGDVFVPSREYVIEQLPCDAEGVGRWTKRRSLYFRARFLGFRR